MLYTGKEMTDKKMIELLDFAMAEIEKPDANILISQFAMLPSHLNTYSVFIDVNLEILINRRDVDEKCGILIREELKKKLSEMIHLLEQFKLNCELVEKKEANNG